MITPFDKLIIFLINLCYSLDAEYYIINHWAWTLNTENYTQLRYQSLSMNIAIVKFIIWEKNMQAFKMLYPGHIFTENAYGRATD
jgi:hypothetical protein